MMKLNIYIVLVFLMGINFTTAQDVSLTNARLDRPQSGEEYGSACFTLISEDGLQATDYNLAVEVTLSKVDFDITSISGFNSDNFHWTQDQFASNVIRGTLIFDIEDVDNGGGGAQVCIPVKRNTEAEYNENRNGFQVNVIPGDIEQGGNAGADDISRFVFSNMNTLSAYVEDFKVEKLRKDVKLTWTNNSYAPVDYFEIEKSFDGFTFETIEIVPSSGRLLDLKEYEYMDISAENEAINTRSTQVFYRIKQYDLKGVNHDSEIKNVDYDVADIHVDIYPNPSVEIVNIRSQEMEEGTSITIYNSIGQVINSNQLKQKAATIDVRQWDPGIYHIEFRNPGGQITTSKKLVVVK